MSALLVALLIVACLLAGVELVRSRATSLLAWAVFLIGIVLVVRSL